MGRIICRENECTGCNACVNVCPKNAISTKKVLSGYFFMEIDGQKCINCGKCEKVCPQKLSIRENLATLQKELDEAVK